METNKLVKISSITKKLVVALLGAFLLLFLLFHMCANLCVLREDDGAWYSAFCHFMGTNIFVKVFEIGLLAILLLHIVLALLLQLANRKARPVGYRHSSRTKTAKGSKLAMWTGILLLAFLVMHFCQFYFVKIGLVEGSYMVKTEELFSEISRLQYGELPELAADHEKMQNLENMMQSVSESPEMMSRDHKWLRHLTVSDKAVIKDAFPEVEVEPDFYYQARNLFKNPLMVVIYLLTFVVLWLHMRHAFESAFQTLGLNNYKYNKAIEVIGIIYAWVICLGFAAVPIYVLLFI